MIDDITLWLCSSLSRIEHGHNWEYTLDFPIKPMVIFHSYVKLPEGMVDDRWYYPLVIQMAFEHCLNMILQHAQTHVQGQCFWDFPDDEP